VRWWWWFLILVGVLMAEPLLPPKLETFLLAVTALYPHVYMDKIRPSSVTRAKLASHSLLDPQTQKMNLIFTFCDSSKTDLLQWGSLWGRALAEGGAKAAHAGRAHGREGEESLHRITLLGLIYRRCDVNRLFSKDRMVRGVGWHHNIRKDIHEV
jgi:hypothetical protein